VQDKLKEVTSGASETAGQERCHGRLRRQYRQRGFSRKRICSSGRFIPGR
jgi:hypothetical protein